jgi:hypothetical protein
LRVEAHAIDPAVKVLSPGRFAFAPMLISPRRNRCRATVMPNPMFSSPGGGPGPGETLKVLNFHAFRLKMVRPRDFSLPLGPPRSGPQSLARDWAARPENRAIVHSRQGTDGA